MHRRAVTAFSEFTSCPQFFTSFKSNNFFYPQLSENKAQLANMGFTENLKWHQLTIFVLNNTG